MPNAFLTTEEITYRAIARFMNSSKFAAMIDRQYNDRFARVGGKIGRTVDIRIPPRYVSTPGPVAQIQDTVETFTPLTLDIYRDIALSYTSEDLVLSIDDFDNRIIAPAVDQLANDIDMLFLEAVYRQVHHVVGTPGVRPNDSQLFLDAKAIMMNESTPRDLPWQALLAPLSEASVVKSLQGLFNDQATIGGQYKRGEMATALGFDWDVDQNMPVHTIGTLGSTPAVNNSGQTGSSLITDGWSAGATVKRGDIFTIATVFGVNPLNRRNTSQLQQFVVTEDRTADGSGNMTIPIFPPIVPPNADGTPTQQQTVTRSPVDGSLLTIFGPANTVSPQNLCFYPKFATAAFVDLPEPKSGRYAVVAAPDMGFSMRLWEDSEFLTDTHGARLDVLCGICVTRPMWACRVAA